MPTKTAALREERGRSSFIDNMFSSFEPSTLSETEADLREVIIRRSKTEYTCQWINDHYSVHLSTDQRSLLSPLIFCFVFVLRLFPTPLISFRSLVSALFLSHSNLFFICSDPQHVPSYTLLPQYEEEEQEKRR